MRQKSRVEATAANAPSTAADRTARSSTLAGVSLMVQLGMLAPVASPVPCATADGPRVLLEHTYSLSLRPADAQQWLTLARL